MSCAKEDVAGQLHQWALEEMHFRPQGRHVNSKLPSVDDFRNICRGQMVDIWKFVIQHVYSAQTVQKVKGNLALKHQQLSTLSYRVKYQGTEQYSSERDELLETKRALTAELASLKSDVHHVERDLSKLKKDILGTEQAYRESCTALGELRRRSALLKAHSQQCEELHDCYQEFERRMNGKIEKYKQLQSYGHWRTDLPPSKDFVESTFYSRKREEGEREVTAVEGACAKHVRETCDSIGQFLQQVLQGSFGNDRITLAQRKDLLWKDIEMVFSEYPVNQIVTSLVSNTQYCIVSNTYYIIL
ncbi:AUGMIN subunit 5-like [Lingula anatina]|uniref:AUGMIN subunit 5-like n=1 Tax=Lingula anatina TaxID=7574 RepID=A0A1S3KH64_LINAN|nr:AUGMIN subunit 5-like [Lingula anatina]|eukprot:XP_013421970.1 AUGMIN subunit 5-like [Lingula anatina]